jgi:hypothetical protein
MDTYFSSSFSVLCFRVFDFATFDFLVAALSRPSWLLPLVNGAGSTRDLRPSNGIRIDSVVFCPGCRLVSRYPIDDQWRSGSCMRRLLRRTGHGAFFYLGLALGATLGYTERIMTVMFLEIFRFCSIIIRGSAGLTAPPHRRSCIIWFLFLSTICARVCE